MTIFLFACSENSTQDGVVVKESADITDTINSPRTNESRTTDDPETPTPLENEKAFSREITIQVGSQSFKATIEDNPTSRAFIEKLSLSLEMQDLNGNEKFYYFAEELPSESISVDEIAAGDLMIYGSDCLVLFYESFATSYSYTRLGKIDEPTKLADTLGSGNVTIDFKLGY